ncbi:MAG: chorismate synthase [Deltaproteobacteria bacterium]|nr:chorismate synthase [Deltaproteobacteria bacterium]
MSLRWMDGGESHGKGLTVIIDGIPAGLKIDLKKINEYLQERQKGYGRGGRMDIEKDSVDIRGGIRGRETIGSPVVLFIENKDWINWKEKMDPFEITEERLTKPRPGHADLPGYLKYNRRDLRDVLERSSARQTATRTAVGAIAREILEELGIYVTGFVRQIGKVNFPGQIKSGKMIREKMEQSAVRCPDEETTKLMCKEIEKTKQEGDTLGGVIEVICENVIPGLGTYVQWDRRLDAHLAFSLMSIQAIKAVEIGGGIENASKKGSQVHDEIFYSQEKGYFRKTNRAGGIEGGMSNGENIVLKAYMKPIPTLRKRLHSVDVESKKEEFAFFERSDVCAVPAASVICEAAISIELASFYLEKFGGDTMDELKENLYRYNEYLERK